jgi:hypothetical protein
MSEQENGANQEAPRRFHAALANQCWRAIFDADVQPVPSRVFFDEIAKRPSDYRELYTGLFYTLARAAYQEALSPETHSLEHVRRHLHDSSLTVLRSIHPLYQNTRSQAVRNSLLGLINEFTPVALLNGPFITANQAAVIASREDDNTHKTDLYLVGAAEPFTRVQVKTDTAASVADIPKEGIIIFAEDYMQFAKDIPVTRALVGRFRSPAQTALLRHASERLVATIDARLRQTPTETAQELSDLYRRPDYHNPMSYAPGLIGEQFPELEALRSALARKQSDTKSV